MEIIYELSDSDEKWWSDKIKEFRLKIIKLPRQYINEFTAMNRVSTNDIKKDVSGSIKKIRQGCWDLYIKDEILFHREVVKFLLKEREVPKDILKKVIETEFSGDQTKFVIDQTFKEKMANVIGDYSGRIMPFIYHLSLSTTNSRRSRSGKTFEGVIEYILDAFSYPYEDQSKLGTGFYKKHNIGKMVDCIIPNKESYEQSRTKCMVITMKTSLRERWQEVAEEISRTNIPHIYLLTLDEDLTKGTLINVKQQNITIVTYASIKKDFSDFKNIISFETFFKTEIPRGLVYWNE